ncbi:Scr1 family TA system antitoxin-like transcriptional regulator [Streptomyces sp. NPDC086023]|uniref:helix-turn-helix domain-containing protein n=1 Tax=Streptomyces sp. NPDC086023 TaxID=3365746 RepID=UPI0037D84EB9
MFTGRSSRCVTTLQQCADPYPFIGTGWYGHGTGAGGEFGFMAPRKRVPRNGTALKMVGAQVAVLRRANNMTQRELAGRLRMDEETIGSIEQGRRALMPDVAERMDAVLKTGGVLAAAVAHLPPVDRVPEWAEQYMRCEKEAIALSWYDNQVVPGLLQTENYARAVFRCRVPAFRDEKIEELTSDRLQRQAILRRESPPTLSFVIWEPVVRHQIGGPEVHAELLQHLITCSRLPDVSVQVMPLSQPNHSALDGPFTLLETPDHQHLGYSESQRGSQLIADGDEVSIMARRYAMLRTQALNPGETRGLLDRLLGEL